MVLNEISKCRFGSVHLATHLKSRQVAAIKFIPTNVVKCFDNVDVLENLSKQKNGLIDIVSFPLKQLLIFIYLSRIKILCIFLYSF